MNPYWHHPNIPSGTHIVTAADQGNCPDGHPCMLRWRDPRFVNERSTTVRTCGSHYTGDPLLDVIVRVPAQTWEDAIEAIGTLSLMANPSEEPIPALLSLVKAAR